MKQDAILHKLLVLIFACLLAIFDVFADPFGLGSATDRLSEGLLSSVISPFYGLAEEGPQKGQSKISVLLFDDTYLEESKRKWPLTFKQYRQGLEVIASAQPEAIFVDIYFLASSKKRASQIESFYDDVQEIEEDYGVNIYLASKIDNRGMWQEVIKPHRSALVQMKVDEGRYALTQETSLGKKPVAAFSLYQEYCANHAGECSGNINDLDQSVMFPQWGYSPSDAMQGYYKSLGIECQNSGQGLLGRLWESTRLLFYKAISGMSEGWSTNCLYHDQVNMWLVENMSLAEREKAIKGRYIFVGANINAIPDLIKSPVQGVVPGVFLHAMALDNLIEFGDDFLRDVEGASAEVIEALIICLVLIVYSLLPVWFESRSLCDDNKSLNLDGFYFYLGCTALLSLVLFLTLQIHVSRVAPDNWLGFSLLVLIVEPKVAEAFSRVIHNKFSIRSRMSMFSRVINSFQLRSEIFSVVMKGIKESVSFIFVLFFVLVIFFTPLVLFTLDLQGYYFVGFFILILYFLTLFYFVYKIFMCARSLNQY